MPVVRPRDLEFVADTRDRGPPVDDEPVGDDAVVVDGIDRVQGLDDGRVNRLGSPLGGQADLTGVGLLDRVAAGGGAAARRGLLRVESGFEQLPEPCRDR